MKIYPNQRNFMNQYDRFQYVIISLCFKFFRSSFEKVRINKMRFRCEEEK